MPTNYIAPGASIEEMPSDNRTITAVPTSVTAFVGRALRGSVDEPLTITSFDQYKHEFGGLWELSSLSYAVYHYFLNGGSEAVIVRVFNETGSNSVATFEITEENGSGLVVFAAASAGSWGSSLLLRIDHNNEDSKLFDLKVKDTTTGLVEVHLNLTVSCPNARFVGNVLERKSNLLRVQSIQSKRPQQTPVADPAASDFSDNLPHLSNALLPSTGVDGDELTDTDIIGAQVGSGLHALDQVDIINLLCIPPYDSTLSGDVLSGDIGASVRIDALNYAKNRKALLLLDPPSNWNIANDPIDEDIGIESSNFGMARDPNAVLYFPRIMAPDPLQVDRIGSFATCGTVAGVLARTDTQRGVWKAPAGVEARLSGTSDLEITLSRQHITRLSQQGINCLRKLPNVGHVIWSARTMDSTSGEWKYIPVRRLALFIEESLYRGSKWLEFEPNNESSWAQIRFSFDDFMNDLFCSGAFQGSKAEDAYFIKCDSETTTQSEINEGIVNIVVGFAPLKPAEFIIIRIQQTAAQHVDA